MNTIVNKLKNKVLNGENISKMEALELYNTDFDALTSTANEIRKHFCGNSFDICTIINGKSGRCSENCKYCAQSTYYNTSVNEYPLLDSKKILKEAKYNYNKGVLRYSIVTSGKALSDKEIHDICEIVKAIKKETNISVCVSLGLLNQAQFSSLKSSGVTRIHNNIETSIRNFPNICTTHTFKDKIATIKAAQAAGLNVCSGGIIGLGETIEDRIDMALSIRELGIRSIPINMLNPIVGTPYENNDILTASDMCRIVAVYRFIIPDSFIRLAGGRELLSDKGRACFLSGANAAISGDMLTTSGISIDNDLKMLHELGYNVELFD